MWDPSLPFSGSKSSVLALKIQLLSLQIEILMNKKEFRVK